MLSHVLHETCDTCVINWYHVIGQRSIRSDYLLGEYTSYSHYRDPPIYIFATRRLVMATKFENLGPDWLQGIFLKDEPC